MADSAEIAIRVARALEAAGVEYFLGGSMASSVQGGPRLTRDDDFVVAVGKEFHLSIRKRVSLTFVMVGQRGDVNPARSGRKQR